MFVLYSKMLRTRCSSMVRALANGAMGRLIDPTWMDPLSYFSFQPVLHNWCNKGCGMCYPVCGMVHIKEPLFFCSFFSSKKSSVRSWCDNRKEVGVFGDNYKIRVKLCDSKDTCNLPKLTF